MIQKFFDRWFALKAFNALSMYYTSMSDRSVEAGKKVIDVLDIIRKDLK